jgi:hypothetical protein
MLKMLTLTQLLIVMGEGVLEAASDDGPSGERYNVILTGFQDGLASVRELLEGPLGDARRRCEHHSVLLVYIVFAVFSSAGEVGITVIRINCTPYEQSSDQSINQSIE